MRAIGIRRLAARRGSLVVVLGALVVSAAATSAASGAVIASVAAPTSVSTYAGWIAWSDRAPDGRYRLILRRPDGSRLTVPGSRSVPYDVDLGPSMRGDTVAVFTRCRSDPPSATQPGVTGRPSARGCAIVRFDPESGRLRTLRRSRVQDGGIWNPAISGRRLVWAARAVGGRRVEIVGRVGRRADRRVALVAAGQELSSIGDLDLRGDLVTAVTSTRARGTDGDGLQGIQVGRLSRRAVRRLVGDRSTAERYIIGAAWVDGTRIGYAAGSRGASPDDRIYAGFVLSVDGGAPFAFATLSSRVTAFAANGSVAVYVRPVPPVAPCVTACYAIQTAPIPR